MIRIFSLLKTLFQHKIYEIREAPRLCNKEIN